jgi:cellulose synthase/poly-beta-1,6-N-acetylglucosamine synthase-like glycosyltransferase
MTLGEVLFWLAAVCVLCPYLLYPLFITVLAALCARPLRPRQPAPRSVSIVLAAYNEESGIDRRLTELTALLEATGLEGEVLVVSDGSTDATASIARTYTKRFVRVLELPERSGKAVALTAGCAEARHEIIVFADARQTWAPDALALLLENFADPDVGAVSGDLVLIAKSGALAGVGLYWHIEKWLRRQESRVGSQVGVTGAIAAVRRELFRPIPPGTLLDDVYWPLSVAMQGGRVIHDKRALAYDRLPERARDEFRRKVRTLAGNFQLVARLPGALLPWRNPVWFPFLAHKMMRLLVPWALILLLVLSAVLPGQPYEFAFTAQLLCYGLAFLGLVPGVAGHFRPAGLAASFLVLNSAAWVGLWVWLFGRAGQSWQKVTYAKTGPLPPPSPGAARSASIPSPGQV